MKKTLNCDLTLYFSTIFPYRASRKVSKKTSKGDSVTISIGGNIGDTKKIFNKLFLYLQQDNRFKIEKTSPILRNPPFGYLEQNDFFNAVMVLKTSLNPFECLKAFQRYENRFKRKRSFQDAPRTLDIDIIFYNKQKINTTDLKVPHIGYKERQSVLIPLKFL